MSNLGNQQLGDIILGLGAQNAFSAGFGQAQALILATYYAHAQSQALIRQTYQGYAQAQAWIIPPSAFGQAQARIIAFDVSRYAQAQAQIKGNHAFGQAQAYIYGISAWFKLDDTSSPLLDSINGNTPVVTGSPTYSEPSQSPNFGDKSIRFNGAYFEDTTPGILPTGAQGRTITFWFKTGSTSKQVVVSYGTNSTRQLFEVSINDGSEGVSFSVFGDDSTTSFNTDDNAWHFVAIAYPPNGTAIFTYIDGALEGFSFLDAPLNTVISGTGLVLGANHSSKGDTFDDWLNDIKIYTKELSLLEIQTEQTKRFAVGQAQALIYSQHPLKYGQAQAQIRHPEYWVLGQAQGEIAYKRWEFGQAQTSIKAVYNSSGQAQATISIQRRVFGQAQAFIHAPQPLMYAQAQAYIGGIRLSQETVEVVYVTDDRAGRISQIPVEVVYVSNDNRYARVSQIVVEFIAATVRNYNVHGQAQADIKQTYNAHGQAQAYIGHFVHGQAQAKINAFGVNAYGQAQAIIRVSYDGYGQAQAYIRPRVGLGQARARIKIAYNAHGQAQALIRVRFITTYGQAQAQIIYTPKAYGQAMAYIGFHAFAQAQARIVSFSVPKHGNAMGYIKVNTTIPPPGPSSSHQSYLVRYNGYDLPGYAQSENYSDIMRIVDHFPAMADFQLAEYTGLQNKIISMEILLWEPSYLEVKEKLSLVSTMLHSAKGFTKLYIQRGDRYFLAITSSVGAASRADKTNRLLVYGVEFETKPWLISEQTYELSGTGLIETIDRTLYDGTWTPTIVTVTGTDVTITGYTDYASTGSIEIEGSCTDLVIDTEAHTAYEGGVLRNDLITNKDFSLYVGPGKTYFQIDGATSCTIRYNKRWTL